MIPPVFTTLKDVPAIVVILADADGTLRITPWEEAPQDTLKPYVTYTVYNGIPENTLDKVPEVDNLGTQVDVWAPTGDACVQLAILVRDALEPVGHMIEVGAMEKDTETKLYRLRMSFDFFTFR